MKRKVYDICLTQVGSRLIEAESAEKAIEYFIESATGDELLSMLEVSADDSATDEVRE